MLSKLHTRSGKESNTSKSVYSIALKVFDTQISAGWVFVKAQAARRGFDALFLSSCKIAAGLGIALLLLNPRHVGRLSTCRTDVST